MAGNTINVQGSYVDIHDNEVVNLTVDKALVRMGDQVQGNASQGAARDDGSPEVGVSTLVASVDAVRQYFWGESAMAVVFGVCRDCYGYGGSMRQFERAFGCSEGVLSNAFRNNPYMRLSLDKWPQQGAKQRVLQLAAAYQKAVTEAISTE